MTHLRYGKAINTPGPEYLPGSERGAWMIGYFDSRDLLISSQLQSSKFFIREWRKYAFGSEKASLPCIRYTPFRMVTPDLDPLFFPLMEFHRLAITSRWRRLAAAYNAITYQTRTVVKAKEFDALTARMTNPLWWCHGTPHAVKLEALLMYPTEELGWHSGCHAAHIAAKVGAQGVVLNSKREYMWKGEDGEMVTPLITERKADGSFPKNALLAKPPFTGAELDAALRAFAEGVNANGMYLLIERQQGHNKPPVEWIDVDEEPMVGEFYL